MVVYIPHVVTGVILNPAAEAGSCVDELSLSSDEGDVIGETVPIGGVFVGLVEGGTPGVQDGGDVGGTEAGGALEGGDVECSDVDGAGSEELDEDVAGHGTFTQTCSTFGRGG